MDKFSTNHNPQLSVHNASGIVFSPDGQYAFVTGRADQVNSVFGGGFNGVGLNAVGVSGYLDQFANPLYADGNVGITYGDKGDDTWVSISGTATVSEDRQLKERLFNPMVKAWFPGGLDDPNLELIEVHIEHAEYWDIDDSKMTQLLKMATAAVTGKPPTMGEHKELTLG